MHSFMSTHVFYWPTFSCNGNHFCFIKLKNFNVFLAGNQKFLRKTFWSNFWSTKSFHDFPKRLFEEPTTKMLEDTLNVFQTIDFRNQTYEWKKIYCHNLIKHFESQFYKNRKERRRIFLVQKYMVLLNSFVKEQSC